VELQEGDKNCNAGIVENLERHDRLLDENMTTPSRPVVAGKTINATPSTGFPGSGERSLMSDLSQSSGNPTANQAGVSIGDNVKASIHGNWTSGFLTEYYADEDAFLFSDGNTDTKVRREQLRKVETGEVWLESNGNGANANKGEADCISLESPALEQLIEKDGMCARANKASKGMTQSEMRNGGGIGQTVLPESIAPTAGSMCNNDSRPWFDCNGNANGGTATNMSTMNAKGHELDFNVTDDVPWFPSSRDISITHPATQMAL